MPRSIQLNQCEREILTLITRGNTIARTAGIMHMSVQEVEDTIRPVIRRAQCTSLDELTEWFRCR